VAWAEYKPTSLLLFSRHSGDGRSSQRSECGVPAL